MRFVRDGCALMAAATAFYGLVSLVPLAALAISVLGRVSGSAGGPNAEHYVLSLLNAVLPLHVPGVEEAIRHVPRPGGSWFVEAISVLALLWSGSRLFHTLEDVLTRVWSGHRLGRPLFARHLIALCATLVAGTIFLLTVLATATAAALASREEVRHVVPRLRWLAPLANTLATLAAAWLMFVLMYVFLPQERVSWGAAAIGAALAAVLWEVSRAAFARVVAHSAGYGQLYGSLAGVVVMGFWIYLTASIMLIGAETAVVLQASERAEEG